MGENQKMTVAEVAIYLSYTKSYIQRLIRQNRLIAELQNVPIKFYLIDSVSVERFKNTPKNKGGRPRKSRV